MENNGFVPEYGKYYRNLYDNTIFKFKGGYPVYQNNFDEDVYCELELWEPKESEFCYFYNDKEKKEAVLGKFWKMEEDYYVQYIDTTSEVNDVLSVNLEEKAWKYCEPFTQEIPEFLKGK